MKKHLSYLATAALIASPALAEDLTVTPTVASRITAGGRTFSCYACEPFSVLGEVVCYQLDVGEVGT